MSSKSGPGRSYRTGITLVELFDMFPDEDAARKWFEDTRWPEGTICPRCNSSERVSAISTGKPMPWFCNSDECKRYFSVKIGTAMEGSRLPLRKWAIALYLVSTSLKGVSSMKLHRDLGITQKSAWFMSQRIREGFRAGIVKMAGEIEVDETYIGGLEKNKHPRKRRGVRGPSGKAIVVGARSREGEIRAKHVRDGSRSSLVGFIAGNTTRRSIIYTDENRVYKTIPGRAHHSVNHGVGQYVNEQAHVNGMESFWAMLKRGYHGTFHHISRKHLNRYVQEFATRQSRRELSTLDNMRMLTKTMVGRRLTYRDLIR